MLPVASALDLKAEAGFKFSEIERSNGLSAVDLPTRSFSGALLVSNSVSLARHRVSFRAFPF